MNKNCEFEKDLISIIVPVYNAESKVEKCIESLVGQTYKNIEIIIVNDGSTDNSLDVCKKYADKDSRIVLIDKKNGGVSSARNAGLQSSRGKYVMFADSDDYTELFSCQYMIDAIKQNDADMVISGFYSVDENGKIKSHICDYKVCKNVGDLNDRFEYIYRECFFNSPWNKLYKKEFITKYFREDMRYFEDYYFNIEYMENICSFVMIDSLLYYYMEDTKNSLTKVFRQDLFDVFPTIYLKQIDFFNGFFGNKFDLLFRESLIYGLYNSIQKLVYSAETFKFKINVIKKWTDNDVVKSVMDKNTISEINKKSGFQYKLGYTLLLRKKYILLVFWFDVKKILSRLR